MFDDLVMSLCGSLTPQSSTSGDEYKEFKNKFRRIHPDYAEVIFPPIVLSTGFVENMVADTRFLLKMVASIPNRVFNGNYRRLLKYQGHSDDEIDLLLPYCNGPFLSVAIQLARPDYIPTWRGIRLVEMNIAAPIGGIGVLDRYMDNVRETTLAEELRASGISLEFPPLSRIWLDTLLIGDPTREGHAPYIVEVAKDEETAQEFGEAEAIWALRRQGVQAAEVPFHNLIFRQDGLYVDRRKVDVLISGFIYSEAKAKGILKDCSQILEKQQNGQLTYYGSPVHTIFDNKINLAILTADEFTWAFTRNERENISRLIPKTSVLNSKTLEQILENQQKLVLKPATEFGGTGIVIGRAVSREEWKTHVLNALNSACPYIIQELVGERILRKAIGPRGPEDREMVLGCCMFGGRFAGTLIREKCCGEGGDPVINCATGASFGAGVTASVSGNNDWNWTGPVI